MDKKYLDLDDAKQIYEKTRFLLSELVNIYNGFNELKLSVDHTLKAFDFYLQSTLLQSTLFGNFTPHEVLIIKEFSKSGNIMYLLRQTRNLSDEYFAEDSLDGWGLLMLLDSEMCKTLRDWLSTDAQEYMNNSFMNLAKIEVFFPNLDCLSEISSNIRSILYAFLNCSVDLLKDEISDDFDIRIIAKIADGYIDVSLEEYWDYCVFKNYKHIL